MREYGLEACVFGWRVWEFDGEKKTYIKRTTRTGWTFCKDATKAKHWKKIETAKKHMRYLSAIECARICGYSAGLSKEE